MLTSMTTGYHRMCCQRPGYGRVYYLRTICEGKTPAEARRALKRRLTNILYRHILKDQQRRPNATT
jgi:transposase